MTVSITLSAEAVLNKVVEVIRELCPEDTIHYAEWYDPISVEHTSERTEEVAGYVGFWHPKPVSRKVAVRETKQIIRVEFWARGKYALISSKAVEADALAIKIANAVKDYIPNIKLELNRPVSHAAVQFCDYCGAKLHASDMKCSYCGGLVKGVSGVQTR